MTWNYRVMKHEFPDAVGGPVTMYGLHEVFYENGTISTFTKESVCGLYESVAELTAALKLMSKAAKSDLPELNYKKQKINDGRRI